MKKLILVVLTVVMLCVATGCKVESTAKEAMATPSNACKMPAHHQANHQSETEPRATVIPSPTPEVTQEVRFITLDEYHERKMKYTETICYAKQNFQQDVAYSDLILEVTPNDYVIQELDNLGYGKETEIVMCYDFKYRHTILYNFQVISVLKGQYDGGDINIQVGEKQLSTYQKGSTYILLVRKYDSVFHDTLYSLKSYNIEVQDTGLSIEGREPVMYRFKDTTEFQSFIERNARNYANKLPGDVSVYTDSIYPMEIVDFSDCVVEAHITSVRAYGDHHLLTNMCVEAVHKGDLSVGDTIHVTLFPQCSEDASYLLCLDQATKINYSPSSPYGCVNLKETERYQQYMDCLEAMGLTEESEE